ncbi:MAG: hypothetical protein ACNS63_06450 [Candidatus Nitrospinota bacterium M3_3B_026]
MQRGFLFDGIFIFTALLASLFMILASCSGGGGSGGSTDNTADPDKIYYGGSVNGGGDIGVAVTRGDVSEAITFEGHTDGAGNIDRVDGVVYANKDTGGTLTIYYGSDLRPSRVVDSVSGVTFELGEYADGAVTATIKDAKGTVLADNYRMEMDAAAFNYFADAKAAARAGAPSALTDSEAYAVNVTSAGAGVAAGAVACGASIVATGGTAGAAMPVAVAACGGYVVSVISASCTVAEAQGGLCDAMVKVDGIVMTVNCAGGSAVDCVLLAGNVVMASVTETKNESGDNYATSYSLKFSMWEEYYEHSTGGCLPGAPLYACPRLDGETTVPLELTGEPVSDGEGTRYVILEGEVWTSAAVSVSYPSLYNLTNSSGACSATCDIPSTVDLDLMFGVNIYVDEKTNEVTGADVVLERIAPAGSEAGSCTLSCPNGTVVENFPYGPLLLWVWGAAGGGGCSAVGPEVVLKDLQTGGEYGVVAAGSYQRAVMCQGLLAGGMGYDVEVTRSYIPQEDVDTETPCYPGSPSSCW